MILAARANDIQHRAWKLQYYNSLPLENRVLLFAWIKDEIQANNARAHVPKIQLKYKSK